jgi:hypothetical protein
MEYRYILEVATTWPVSTDDRGRAVAESLVPHKVQALKVAALSHYSRSQDPSSLANYLPNEAKKRGKSGLRWHQYMSFAEHVFNQSLRLFFELLGLPLHTNKPKWLQNDANDNCLISPLARTSNGIGLL